MHQKLPVQFILSVVLSFISLGVQAQTDSVSIVSQPQSDDSYFNLKYEYLDILLRDETRLFKIAISPFKPSENYDFGVIVSQLSYERKFNTNWSTVAELNQNLNFLNGGTLFLNSLDLGVRRYLNKSKQIKEGISGNNCNGIYLGAKASNILLGVTHTSVGTDENYVNFKLMPELNMGIQQRISNLFYVDANAFFNYDWMNSKPGYGITVLFGLAFNVND